MDFLAFVFSLFRLLRKFLGTGGSQSLSAARHRPFADSCLRLRQDEMHEVVRQCLFSEGVLRLNHKPQLLEQGGDFVFWSTGKPVAGALENHCIHESFVTIMAKLSESRYKTPVDRCETVARRDCRRSCPDAPITFFHHLSEQAQV